MALLISPLLVIAVFWKGAEIIAPLQALFADRPGALQALICAALCTVASMNDMTAPSVSLEGRTLYLIQSLPVTPWQALRAKARMQVILTAPPVLLCAVCLLCVFQISLTEALLVLQALLLSVSGCIISCCCIVACCIIAGCIISCRIIL